jgi:hypothetical protein
MRPILATFPTSDPAFRDAAAACLERFAGPPESFQALLRRRYPRAVVRPRDLSGEVMSVWYVYRDGVWTSH